MKTSKAFAAVATLIAAGLASAQSSLVLYGGLDASADYNKAGFKATKRLDSGGALGNRLGFRGSEDLGDGLSAVFRLEMGLNLDTGTLGQSGRAFGREAFVGLSDKTLGTVVAGRLQLPYYMVGRAVDAFGWVGSAGTTSASYGPTSASVLPTTAIARADNAIRYDSPTWAGVTARALVAASEGSAQLGRTVGASVAYTKAPWDVALGWSRQDGSGNAAGTGKVKAVIVGGSYDFEVVKVFAGYNRESNDCSTCTGFLTRGSTVRKGDFTLLNVGARYPLTQSTVLIGQFMRIDDHSVYRLPTQDRDVNWYGVGAEYFFSKRTNLFASAATLKNKNGSQYNIGNGTIQQPSGSVNTNNPRVLTYILGVRHFF